MCDIGTSGGRSDKSTGRRHQAGEGEVMKRTIGQALRLNADILERMCRDVGLRGNDINQIDLEMIEAVIEDLASVLKEPRP